MGTAVKRADAASSAAPVKRATAAEAGAERCGDRLLFPAQVMRGESAENPDDKGPRGPVLPPRERGGMHSSKSSARHAPTRAVIPRIRQ